MNPRKAGEVVLRGLPVSPGIAIGRLFLVGLPAVDRDAATVKPSEIDRELDSLRAAVTALKQEIERAQASATGPEKGIRRTHLMLLEDPSLVGEIERQVAENQRSLAAAITTVMESYEEKFDAFEEILIRERAIDIKDVCTQLLNMHIDRYQRAILTPEEPFVVAARELLPSQTARIDRAKLLGVISELGGATSHTAILARSYGIPAVCGIPGLLSALHPAARLIVDGTTGTVIVNPKPATLAAYRQRQATIRADVCELYEAGPVHTRDGVRVTLLANVNRPEDMTAEIVKTVDGVGLFRTEYFFMTSNRLPSEEEQFRIYRDLCERAAGKEVVIRTLDAGGDKVISYLKAGHEDNPMMGCRSIRLCLQRPEIILPQIRAILRAAVYGNAWAMLPLITTRSELERAREIFREASAKLEAEGVEHRADVPLGVLVEVPAAALNIRSLLALADFISVGTNDLTQYTLAVDRGNPRVAHLFQPLHPAMLTLLAKLARAARAANKSLSMCGEMAADLENTMLLLGLGYRRLSVSPFLLPPLRRRIQQVNVSEARRLAARALKLGSRREIAALLDAENTRCFAVPVP
ncbi:MAG: phosphoenolpyruvate--protein phosphotransferase [Planctomycetes bacterium]|nr:phosphoenolpyruvate--protein phosphotransferase [Planctomycetota bacterium]